MKFYSKVLLFGEHIVNKGAKALAVPYSSLYCQLTFEKQNEFILPESETILTSIYNHIQTLSELAQIFNLNQFSSDIKQGLMVEMNIPVGYGLGSSGALVACIYEKYCTQKESEIDKLKHQLGAVESVFHGKSSGLDPLVSYLNQPVLVDENTRVIAPLKSWNRHFDMWLIDTNVPRKTGPLVNSFIKKFEDDLNFQHAVLSKIVPLNNEIIHHFIEGNYSILLNKIAKLSQLQLEYFDMLILPEHVKIWQKGLSDKQFFLKICGAGGGGFMLCFSINIEYFSQVFSTENNLLVNPNSL
jgi:mevalonate kinase